MKVLISLSGGMDSTTLLGHLLSQGYEVDAVSFMYGSKHNSYEQEAAKNVTKYYGITLRQMDSTSIMCDFDSALLRSGDNIPEGHYTDKTMSGTVVPGRNMIFLTILAGLAWSIGAQKIAIGIHAGDHAIYPDCRTEFFKAMDSAIYLGTDKRIELIAPFVEMNKISILEWGIPNRVPYDLTRTCYKDQSSACGKCGACVERLEAFEKNGIKDPIIYE